MIGKIALESTVFSAIEDAFEEFFTCADQDPNGSDDISRLLLSEIKVKFM